MRLLWIITVWLLVGGFIHSVGHAIQSKKINELEQRMERVEAACK